MTTRTYRIGHSCIKISLPDDMPIPANMSLFETADVPETLDAVYEIRFSDDLQSDTQSAIARKSPGTLIDRPKLIQFETDNGAGECRLLRFEGAKYPYAVTLESPRGSFEVAFDRQYAALLSYDTVFNSLLSLERIMIRKNALILHSSYLDVNGQALLFSGPSGIGKSTQADLWVRHRGAAILNGDKSLLIRETEGWYAHGWPICGSSGICRNESRRIRAIVMLRKAPSNLCRKMNPFSAALELMEQITTNTWDRDFRLRVMDLTDRLIAEVPVYELFCDISEDAVECLDEVLRELFPHSQPLYS